MVSTISHRPIEPPDLCDCVELIRSHPVFRAKYGEGIRDLLEAWRQVLGCESVCAIVFEEERGAFETRICGLGVAVIVSDRFVKEMKTPPFLWIGPELAKRIVCGESPLLSDKQVQEANSHGGLNVVVWEACVRLEYADHMPLYNTMISTFVEEHRGYFWKEIICPQAESAERYQSLLRSGAMLYDGAAGWLEHPDMLPPEIISKPHVMGFTRETEMRRPGSWVGSLFDHHPPQFGFSRSEQRLLLAAFHGLADEELSVELGISLSTVKKTWRAIYQRAANLLPEPVSPDSATEIATRARAKEKKRRLLAYLGNHLEELRPISRRLLRNSAAHAG
jgi:DNA-binding NarL/FixJ family response regulator